MLYFTQWTVLIATTLTIIRCSASITIYRLIKYAYLEHGQRQNDILYTRMITTIDPDNQIWNLVLTHNVFLQTAIPALTLVVIKFRYSLYLLFGVKPIINPMLFVFDERMNNYNQLLN